MHAGALLRSRAELAACESACPGALAQDCATWRADVERQLPSLQLSAKTADGSDPGVVRLVIDGAPLAEPLAGAPIDVDPGKHVLVFEAAAGHRVEVSVDVPRGRKGYTVEVRFPARAAPAAAPPVAPPAPSIAPLVLGGVGLGALGAGLVLGIKGQVDRSHLASTCAPHCQQTAVDAIDREWTVGAVVAAGGGTAALAGGLWWAFNGRARRGGSGVAVTLVPGLRSIGVAGHF
jgi:hypothetical protein